MPTDLPERRQEQVGFPAWRLFAVPICLILISALIETNGVSPSAIAHVMLRAGEALAQAELGLLRHGAG